MRRPAPGQLVTTPAVGSVIELAYDFVTGEGDAGQPGLPDEVVGCLDDIQ